MLLHGQLRPREKAAAMEAFASGEADVLVATTVIEVGIDVPNATVMLVEDAERYGISQLHQLRGRVGRGDARRRCACSSGPRTRRACGRCASTPTASAWPRSTSSCAARASSTGTRQSGLARFDFARLPDDADILERAHARAAALLREDPELARARARAAGRRARRRRETRSRSPA